ncbi:MAG: FAD-dependent oxidoreductase, partial [Deltaproteobacteria bacterium]|nr:FAD-dependent oxidoreductase [Deltaproteobacteria bacterium]
MNNKSFPKKTDVVVVGAGPAGSMLAYHLAKAGLDVVLLDKARFPRGKTCGGGVNVRTQKLIPF